MDTIITNARIVTGTETFSGTVRIEDGIIADIDRAATRVPGAVDIGGDHLLPGLVDVHTDHLEKQVMPRPGVFWDALSAVVTQDAILAAGGTTTVFDSLIVGAVGNPDRRTLLPIMLDGLDRARKSGLMKIDHLLHLRCDTREEGLGDLLATMMDDPTLRFVTLMDDGPRRDPERYRKLERRKGVDEATIEARIAAVPTSADCTASNRERAIALCKAHGIAAASHDDTSAGHIAESVAFGLTISEFPITLESARAARAAGMVNIIGGPNIVKGRSHIGNVSADVLAEEGLIDVVCSDYIPASILQAVWKLGKRADGPGLAAAVAMGSKRPAELFGLHDRGEIALGRRADLIHVAEFDASPIVRAVWTAGRRIV